MTAQFSEAIKCIDGILHNLPYHQARVDRTRAKFGGGKTDLGDILSEIPAHARRGTFKCRVVYGMAVESIEFIPYSFRKIATVGIVENDSIEYGYKYTDRNLLNTLLAKTGCDDVIIIKRRLVTDAFSSNLVFESGSGLFTPDTCLLPGTKRQFLLDTGRIAEKRIAFDDIWSYDRIRFINAMIDLEDGVCIETGKVKRLIIH